MTWIKTIPDDQADGEVREYYAKIRAQRGQQRVHPSPSSLHSLNPKAMWHAAELMWEIMRGPSGLTTRQREMIATVTSLTANCKY
jgi:hypothetical protein